MLRVDKLHHSQMVKLEKLLANTTYSNNRVKKVEVKSGHGSHNLFAGNKTKGT